MVDTGFIAIILCLLVLGAELRHLWRCYRLRHLLFHACRFPWATVSTLAAVRAGGFALLALGAVMLSEDSISPALLDSGFDPEEHDRLLIVLDSSLSMNLRDAGPRRDVSRGTRAADLIQELFHAGKRDAARTSLVVFANQATPLAMDTTDWNVIRQCLLNRSLSEALFDNEKTTVGAVLREVFEELAQPWPKRSAALLLITDGDSEDEITNLQLPESIRRSIVVGVGSAEGKLIGDFQSRQNEVALKAMAEAIHGRYINCNEVSIPPDALGRPPAPPPQSASTDTPSPRSEQSHRALILIGVGSALLVAATISGTLLKPANATPASDATPPFLA